MKLLQSKNLPTAGDRVSEWTASLVEMLSRVILGPGVMLMEIAVSAIFFYSIINGTVGFSEVNRPSAAAAIALAVMASAVKAGIWSKSTTGRDRTGKIVIWCMIVIHATTVIGGATIIAGGETGRIIPANPSPGQIVVIGAISILCVGNKILLNAMFSGKPDLRSVSFYDQDADNGGVS